MLKRFKDFPDVLVLLDNGDGIAKHNLNPEGVIYLSICPMQRLVKTIVEENPSNKSVKEVKSIQDVLLLESNSE